MNQLYFSHKIFAEGRDIKMQYKQIYCFRNIFFCSIERFILANFLLEIEEVKYS